MQDKYRFLPSGFYFFSQNVVWNVLDEPTVEFYECVIVSFNDKLKFLLVN